MKVIDRSPFRNEDSSIGLVDRMRGTWQFGFAWNKEIQSQDRLVSQMNAQLKNRYTLVRDVSLPGVGIPIPLVLIGPTGIQVFYASAIQGFYRAKEYSWTVLDSRSHRYKLSKPNLIKRTSFMSQALFRFLDNKGFQLEETEPVLYFSDPNFHVDSIDPAVHILLADGAARFIEKLAQNPHILDVNKAERISVILSEIQSDTDPSGTNSKLKIGSLQLYRWQWAVLAILVILQLCMMIVFILVIFMAT
jgi:hypothetical protein